MKAKIIRIRLLFVFIVIFGMMTGSASFAQEQPKEKKDNNRFAKTLEFDPAIFATLNINNVRMWDRQDGKSNHSPEENDGVFFPRNTSHVVYQDGIVWGARAYIDEALTQPAPFDQPIRVMGATYGTGCREGWVEGFGATAVPIDKNHPRARIYRIRRDWKEMSAETIKQDAADCYEIPVSEVTEAQIRVVTDDYFYCWYNWPVDLGAPFIDRNSNSVYDPPPPFNTFVPRSSPLYFGSADLIAGGYDEPGIAGADPDSPADMVIWNVYNDLYLSLRFASEPTGMEIHNTVWAYKNVDALDNIYFRKVKFINKGGVVIDENRNKGVFYLDSMYVVQWSDPDLGNAGDDLIGCDTVLNVGYTYNGYAADSKYLEFSLPPPVVGYDIVQGPVIPSPGDIAIYDLKFKQDYKNLGLSGFAYFGQGAYFSDPIPVYYSNSALRWYKMMRGFAPLSGPDVHYPFPPGVEAGPLPFAGDPLTGSGHVDGLGEDYSLAPGDRRILCISGPFQMAPGDTQEVVIALICGLGADRLSGISLVKFNSISVQKYYDSLLSLPNPNVSYKISFPDNATTEFQAQADLGQLFDVTNSEIIFTASAGSESGINLILSDDGAHEDGPAGDNIWGNSIILPNRKYPLNGDLIVHKTTGSDTIPILRNVRLRPAPKLINWRIIWEDGRQDLGINKNEKVHLKFDVSNPDMLQNIDEFKIFNMNPAADQQIISFEQNILPGSIVMNDSLFLELIGPDSGDSITFSYNILFDHHYELAFESLPVVHWNPDSSRGDPLEVISNIGTTENVFAIIADPAQLTGHKYQITFVSDEDQLFWQLTDITTNELKLQNGQITNSSFFPRPVIDGIQFNVISNGSTIKSFQCIADGYGPFDPPAAAAAYWQGYPVPNRIASRNAVSLGGYWLITTDKSGDNNYKTFEDFMNRSFVANGIEELIPSDFEMRFTASGGKAFDYWGTETMIDVPFELWDVGRDPENPADDYRIFAYLDDLDNNHEFNLVYDASDPNGGSGWADHPVSGGTNDPYTDVIYWMSPADNTPGTQGYDKLVAAIETDPGQRPDWDAKPGDASGDYDAWSSFARMVLVLWNGGDVTTANSPADYNRDGPALPETGTIYRIVTSKPNYPGDVLVINSPPPVVAKKNLHLYQNYPNPFNPITFIRFSINKSTNVKIDIFNVLGQRVKTLVNKKMVPGEHALIWNGSNDRGIKLGSGIYFYRFQAGGNVKIKKMTLLK